jgi:hypothetical protein
MADEMRLPTFKGDGSEDPEQHWFLCEVVWSIKNIIDEAVKGAQFSTTLRDRTEMVHEVFPRIFPTQTAEPDQNCVDCRIQGTQFGVTVNYRTKKNQAKNN